MSDVSTSKTRVEDLEEKLERFDEELTKKIDEQNARNEKAWEMRVLEHETRISRRDYFAAHALAALIDPRYPEHIETHAKQAAWYADELIIALDITGKS
jgi:hypothetical protein